MRKLIIVSISVVFLGLIASQALACWWDGYWGGPVGWRGGTYAPGTGSTENYQSFLSDTAQLREELAAKQGEYNALMAQPNPDPSRIGQLTLEIARHHDQLRAKAQVSGLAGPGSSGAPMGGYGYGSGHGGWACW